VEEAGLSESVFFLGPMFGEEKAAAFHHADAFTLPSHSEGLPMAVLEAWSYRLPVVMTPGCNLPEGYEDGAALEIAPKPSSIVDGLGRLFDRTEGQRAEIGERGRALVEKKFTWQSVASQMYEVYSWMLGDREPPSCLRFE
jgi:poly(glycerol-phosphate) alpha-glucosyltransferase